MTLPHEFTISTSGRLGRVDECRRCRKMRVSETGGRVSFVRWQDGPVETSSECIPTVIVTAPVEVNSLVGRL